MRIIFQIKKKLYSVILTCKYVSGNVKKYHYGKEKSWLKRLSDIILWGCNEKEFIKMYYAFGLNLKGAHLKNYIGKKRLFRLKSRAELKIKKLLNIKYLQYDIITKDKYYAAAVLKANSIPSIPTIASITHSELIYDTGEIVSLDNILQYNFTFFIKHRLLEGGDGVFHCQIKGKNIIIDNTELSVLELKKKLLNNIWIIQKSISSHHAIKKINASALNTTRIVTVLDGKDPIFLGGFQAFATNNERIDSWSKGSVYVGIDIDKECLKEYGYCNLSDKQSSIITIHPDSKIEFKDYQIPFLKESVNLCLRAHKLFPAIFIIGWDIAITDDGPVIVEINEKPGMDAIQCINGGYNDKIILHYKNLIKFCK